MPRAVLLATLVTAALTQPAMAAAAPAAAAPFEATAGPFQATPAFSVKFTGTSHTETTFRATPPNPGGDPDHNRAHDASRASWALTATSPLTIPACGASPDSCATVATPAATVGKTSISGTIDHGHVDGLYRSLDATARCRVAASRVPKTGMPAAFDLAYDPQQEAFVVTTRTPIVDALTLLPTSCPGRPDGIDRILDNYFTPGFSFAPGFGADVWFKSAPVAIPAAVWHASTRIRLRPRLAPAARPPADCGTPKVSFTQRCRTSGSWSGVLTFTRR